MKRRKKNKEKANDTQSFKSVMSAMGFAFGIVWKTSKGRLIGAVIKNITEGVIVFITETWLMRYVLNSVQDGSKFTTVITVVLAVSALEILYYILYCLYIRLIEPLQRIKIHSKLNHMLLEKVAKVDLSCYEDTEFYKRFTMTVPEAKGGVDDYAMELLGNVLYGITSLITNAALIMVIDPYLTLLAFIPIISNLLLGKKANKLQYDYQMVSREINRDKDYINRVFYLGEFAKEVRLTNIGSVLLRRFGLDLEKTKKETKKFGLKTVKLLFFKNFTEGNFVRFAGILYVAYRLLISKTVMIGDCLAITNAVSMLSYSLTYISNTYIKAQQHAMFLNNLRDFIAYKPKIATKENALMPDEDNPVIEFRNVRFRYDKTGHDVLKKVSFSIAKGEKIAIVGENGAGKSTLVKLIMRLYDTTGGVVSCGGTDIRDLDLEKYRDLYGVIFQDYKIFAMTVKENVLLGGEGDDETVIEALKAAGVYEKIESLPNGIHTELTKEYFDEGEVLSGGEYQKICIARVFAKKAKIVILDEPSSALDPIAEYQMYETLLKVCEGRSVIFISHRLSSAVLADKVIMMQHGKITEMGSHSQLMANKGAYCDMFTKQAENYLGKEDGE